MGCGVNQRPDAVYYSTAAIKRDVLHMVAREHAMQYAQRLNESRCAYCKRLRNIQRTNCEGCGAP